MKMPALLATIFALLGAPEAFAHEAKRCDDTGKVYKVCGDQRSAYAGKLAQASREKKLLVVVVGAEWCPWCMSMHKMLEEPSFGNGFANRYVLAGVGVYNGKKKVPSGEEILDRIKREAGFTKKLEGIPVLAVVNPTKRKAVIIDTEPLEQNTETTKGHDPKKVLAALEKAAGELNGSRKTGAGGPGG